jgi:hypothetical protein
MESLSVNKEWQKIFDLIPENCAIFGGAIRDLLDKITLIKISMTLICYFLLTKK